MNVEAISKLLSALFLSEKNPSMSLCDVVDNVFVLCIATDTGLESQDSDSESDDLDSSDSKAVCSTASSHNLLLKWYFLGCWLPFHPQDDFHAPSGSVCTEDKVW
jgi:hypothetical protein